MLSVVGKSDEVAPGVFAGAQSFGLRRFVQGNNKPYFEILIGLPVLIDGDIGVNHLHGGVCGGFRFMDQAILCNLPFDIRKILHIFIGPRVNVLGGGLNILDGEAAIDHHLAGGHFGNNLFPGVFRRMLAGDLPYCSLLTPEIMADFMKELVIKPAVIPVKFRIGCPGRDRDFPGLDVKGEAGGRIVHLENAGVFRVRRTEAGYVAVSQRQIGLIRLAGSVKTQYLIGSGLAENGGNGSAAVSGHYQSARLEIECNIKKFEKITHLGFLIFRV